jgi:KaiC/GvpD/RAD55 family RecA-like ATPase
MNKLFKKVNYMKLKRIPTGIESLDPLLQGGLPSGSLVMLLGEIGAGDFEFAITSCARLLMGCEKRDDAVTMPKKVCYISFTRSKEDVEKEIAFSFPAYYNVMQNQRFEFKDFSDAYFARSFIPASWRSSCISELSFESLKWSKEQKNLVETIIDYLDENAYGSIVIIDSLTALTQYCLEQMEWTDLVIVLRGLQKASKAWDGLVYAILNEGILERSKQEEISECMDGVMVFAWEKLNTSQRQRVMYFKKFRSVLPGLGQENIVNFETQISQQKGFDVSNVKRVRGK